MAAAVKVTPDTDEGGIFRGERQVFRLPDGTLYFLEAAAGTFHMYKSTDNCATLPLVKQDAAGEPTVVGNGVIGAAIDSNGLIGIVYPSANTTISYVTFDTSTDSWGSPATVATVTNLENWGGQCIDFDSANKPHVTYMDSTTPDAFYYANKVTGAWSTPIQLSTGTTCYYPTLMVGSANAPIVVYLDATPTAAMVAAIGVDGGGNPANNPTTFTKQAIGVGPSRKLSIGETASGDIVIASAAPPLTTSNGTALSLYRHLAADNWATWQALETVDATARNRGPSIAIKDSDIYVICELTDTGASTVQGVHYYKYTPAGGWEAPVTVETNANVQLVSSRYSYRNNPSYNNYYLDYVFRDGSDAEQYWNYIDIASPNYKGMMSPRSW